MAESASRYLPAIGPGPRLGVIALIVAALAILPAASQAGAQSAQAVAHSPRGSGEVRVHGTCGGGASAWLRLNAGHGKIRIRFRVDSHRGHARWRVVLVREGRIVWRGRVRADGGGSFTVKRRIRNLRGADQVTARALGRRGITCIAQATLRG